MGSFVLMVVGGLSAGYTAAALINRAANWLREAWRESGRTTSAEPVLPSELDDWDAQFFELTGMKVTYDGRLCYDPKLAENNVTSIGSLSLLSSAMASQGLMSSGNPYQQMAQNHLTREQLIAQQQGQQQSQSQLSGLLGGLGNSLGGLFH